MHRKEAELPHIIKQHATALGIKATQAELYIYPCLRILQRDWKFDFRFQHPLRRRKRAPDGAADDP